MVTIYDIAKEAGVSHSTVSRVLSGNKKISEQTAQRVMEVVRRLEYKTKNNVEPSVQRKNMTIGMVTPTYLSNPFFFNIYETIYSTADKAGYSLLLCRMDYVHANQSNVDLIKALYDRVDGIIFIGQLPITEEIIEPFIKNKYPMVSLLHTLQVDGMININVNNFSGAYDATNYLIKGGHKRIAHIMGHGLHIHSNERMGGYSKALEDNGIPMDPRLIKVGNFSYYDTYQCAMDLFNDFSDLTAVFCSTDEMAAAFISAAKDRGLKVPSDISVIGFDDIRPDNLLGKEVPLITTVRQPRHEMASYAVNVLINRIHGMEVPKEKIYYPELIIRNSTSLIK